MGISYAGYLLAAGRRWTRPGPPKAGSNAMGVLGGWKEAPLETLENRWKFPKPILGKGLSPVAFQRFQREKRRWNILYHHFPGRWMALERYEE